MTCSPAAIRESADSWPWLEQLERVERPRRPPVGHRSGHDLVHLEPDRQEPLVGPHEEQLAGGARDQRRHRVDHLPAGITSSGIDFQSARSGSWCSLAYWGSWLLDGLQRLSDVGQSPRLAGQHPAQRELRGLGDDDVVDHFEQLLPDQRLEVATAARRGCGRVALQSSSMVSPACRSARR